MNLKNKKVYIGCPYSSKDENIREERFQKVSELASKLILQENCYVFSPITHSHPIAKYLTKDTLLDADFWLNQDFKFLDICDVLIIYKLVGWENSYGLKKEIDYAIQHNKEIIYID